MASKLSAGIFGKMGDEEADKIGRSARTTAAYNMLASEKGGVMRGLGEIMPIIGGAAGAIIGAGNPAAAQAGMAAGEAVGGIMKGKGVERAQQAVQSAEAENAAAEGQPYQPQTAQQKMANMAQADQQKGYGSQLASAGIDIMKLLQKAKETTPAK